MDEIRQPVVLPEPADQKIPDRIFIFTTRTCLADCTSHAVRYFTGKPLSSNRKRALFMKGDEAVEELKAQLDTEYHDTAWLEISLSIILSELDKHGIGPEKFICARTSQAAISRFISVRESRAPVQVIEDWDPTYPVLLMIQGEPEDRPHGWFCESKEAYRKGKFRHIDDRDVVLAIPLRSVKELIDYEKIDPGIRELVRTLNEITFIFTIESCSGHLRDSSYGVSAMPGFKMLKQGIIFFRITEESKESAAFLAEVEQLVETYPFANIEEHYCGDDNCSDEGTQQVVLDCYDLLDDQRVHGDPDEITMRKLCQVKPKPGEKRINQFQQFWLELTELVKKYVPTET